MMFGLIYSVIGIWHYCLNEIIDTIKNPDEIRRGRKEKLMAIKYHDSLKFYIVVVYNEKDTGGSVDTAYPIFGKPYLEQWE